jgi:lipoic acid synthetase
MSVPSLRGRPDWLRKPKKLTPEVLRTRRRIEGLGLNTVCESAQCPNLGECFARGNATFLILGRRCTRDCRFCAVERGPTTPPDPAEGRKIADYIAGTGIRYAVITSVTRDDLPDGGASHFESVVAELKASLPALRIELLVPDFQGLPAVIEQVARLPIEVFAHNMETVEELYRRARPSADYARSMEVLRVAAAARAPGVRLKTGIMVGLGERAAQLSRLFADLAVVGVEILTIGQYLQPSKFNIPVDRYYKPEEYDRLRELAVGAGIPRVVAGSYVRSSYLAEQVYLGWTTPAEE